MVSAPNFCMGGSFENRCVSHVCGADVALRPPPTRKLGAENSMLQLKI
jgi:hypothetical protein